MGERGWSDRSVIGMTRLAQMWEIDGGAITMMISGYCGRTLSEQIGLVQGRIWMVGYGRVGFCRVGVARVGQGKVVRYGKVGGINVRFVVYDRRTLLFLADGLPHWWLR
jgi:hypothetical protein